MDGFDEPIDDETWNAGASGTSPSAPPPVPPPAPVLPPPPPFPNAQALPRRSRGRLAIAMAAVIVLVSGGAAAFALTRDDGIDYPDEWDPRVADLADFVEDERGERFDHPVEVEFLTPEEYSDRVRSDETELTTEDEASIAAAEALFRAFGLAQGDFDLFGSSNEIADTGTLAFYDPVSDSITVRGTEMTVDLEVTLVHELTHAHQDQTADLVELQEGAGENGAAAVQGLIEGDAVLVEQAYVEEELTDEELAAYDAASVEAADEATADLGDVPEAMLAFFEAPYAFGPPMILGLETELGIEEVFEEPPASDEHLMDPSRYLADDEPLDIEIPEVDGEREVLDEGSVGSLAWFLALAERIDPFQALTAIDGWGGDAYVLTDDGEDTCVRAVVYGDTDDDTDEFRAALDAWAATLPPGMATVGDTGDGGVVVDSCDPGGDVDLALTGRGTDALAIPVTRSYLFADAATAFDDDDAWCLADTGVRALTLEQLADPEGTVFTDGTFDAVIRDAVATCGVG